MSDIILAGFGGQGVLTAGLIMINVAVKQGKNVTWTSSYGAEMRGGTASCSVVISDEEIGSPYPTKLDVLLALNEPSYDKFLPMVKDGGVVVVNSSLVKKQEFPKNLNVYKIAATELANEQGSARNANIYMLGAFVKATGLMEKNFFIEQMDTYFAKKGRKNPENAISLERGYNLAEKV